MQGNNNSKCKMDALKQQWIYFEEHRGKVDLLRQESDLRWRKSSIRAHNDAENFMPIVLKERKGKERKGKNFI